MSYFCCRFYCNSYSEQNYSITTISYFLKTHYFAVRSRYYRVLYTAATDHLSSERCQVSTLRSCLSPLYSWTEQVTFLVAIICSVASINACGCSVSILGSHFGWTASRTNPCLRDLLCCVNGWRSMNLCHLTFRWVVWDARRYWTPLPWKLKKFGRWTAQRRSLFFGVRGFAQLVWTFLFRLS
jgi:hypothetical protein